MTERIFPDLLTKLHAIEIDYDVDDLDWEPYTEFMSAEETTSWIHAWTGNEALTGEEYWIFGQDGTGGYAAFWLVNKDAPVTAQPIVFFGSEGELGPVACSLAEYLWLLAGGLGPMEIIEYGPEDDKHSAVFTAFAEAHAPDAKAPPTEIVARAKAAHPTFADDFLASCE